MCCATFLVIPSDSEESEMDACVMFSMTSDEKKYQE